MKRDNGNSSGSKDQPSKVTAKAHLSLTNLNCDELDKDMAEIHEEFSKFGNIVIFKKGINRSSNVFWFTVTYEEPA